MGVLLALEKQVSAQLTNATAKKVAITKIRTKVVMMSILGQI